MNQNKHYGQRDPESQGKHYINHVEAMTAEDLHRKSAIAAELAHRDIQIEKLRAENRELKAARVTYASEFELDNDGLPDIDNILANIRVLKLRLAVIHDEHDTKQIVPTMETFNPFACNKEVLKNGVSAGMFDIPKETANAICEGISKAAKAKVDWHYVGGRVHIKVLTPKTTNTLMVEKRMPSAFSN